MGGARDHSVSLFRWTRSMHRQPATLDRLDAAAGVLLIATHLDSSRRYDLYSVFGSGSLQITGGAYRMGDAIPIRVDGSMHSDARVGRIAVRELPRGLQRQARMRISRFSQWETTPNASPDSTDTAILAWARPRESVAVRSLPARISFIVFGATLLTSLVVTGISVRSIDHGFCGERSSRPSRPRWRARTSASNSGTTNGCSSWVCSRAAGSSGKIYHSNITVLI